MAHRTIDDKQENRIFQKREIIRMKVGTVTALDYQGIADSIRFFSHRTFLDYDILIWDPNYLLQEYLGFIRYTPRINRVSTRDRGIIHEYIERRDEEMLKMMELGKTIFIYLPQQERINSIEEQYEEDLLYSFEILKGIAGTPIIGTQTECRAEDPFVSFWEKIKDNLEFRARLGEPFGRPFFYVKGTPWVIGTYSQDKNGHKILIPSFKPDENSLGSDQGKRIFIEAITTLVADLNREKDLEISELPLWSKSYILPSEYEQKVHLQKLEGELNTLLQKIKRQKELIKEIEKYKLLFVGTGKALEIQVKKVFEELGFTSTDVLPNRDDLILKYNDKIAVVEIKSVSRKSAAEKHATQLEKWVSEYSHVNEVKPKGILIVNAHSEIPLENRNEVPFPAQMIPYSQAREHCLMTSLQLLGLYLDCKDDEEKKRKMIELIFNTKGVFSEYKDWISFMEKEKDTEYLQE